MDLQTGVSTQLTQQTGNIRDAGPTPLGNDRVMFCSNRDTAGINDRKLRTSQLWVMDRDGQNMEKIGYLNIQSALHPVPMPDGRYLFSSSEEVTSLLSCVKSLKHRTLLLTLYAAGLRISEGAALTIADIDSRRMQLRIAFGKGAKERLVPLSPRLLTELREYWKEVRSPKYLFPGKTFDVPLNSATIQKTCKAAVQQAGILKNVTPHTLRHSYATGLLEAGVDLFTIMRLLGHKSLSTTMIYLHVRRVHLGSTPSPIDWLPVKQVPDWKNPDSDNRE